jgi:hypothetical protein
MLYSAYSTQYSYAVRGTAGYMYYSRHSPLGGGGYGSAHGEGVTGEGHTREAGHGVTYQGGYLQRALIGAGGGAPLRGVTCF